MQHLHIATAAAVAGLAILSGCAAPESPPAAPVTVTAQPQEPDPTTSAAPGDAGDTADPTSPPATTGPASSAEPAPSGEPVPAPTTEPAERPYAVRPGTIGAVKVKTAVFPVQRHGRLATVNLLIAADRESSRFSITTDLSDQNPETAARSEYSVDGLRLVDPVNKKSYLPATNGDGVCACTPADDAMPMFVNSVWVSVVFAAPPTDQTTISVVVPRFGTVTDVPLV